MPSSFVAEGLATRLRLSDDDPALADAFAELDAGETEAGLDALIDAIAASSDDERKDELRKVVVGVLDELGPRTRSRATRAASSPPPCTSALRPPARAAAPTLSASRRGSGSASWPTRRDRRRGLVRLEVVEGGEAHAEQAHGLGRRVGAQQLDRGLGDERGVVGRVRQRAGAGDRRPVGQADLDRDRAALARLALQALAELVGERAQDRLELLVGGDVLSKVRSVETDLAGPPSVSTGESSWKDARAFR